MFFQSNHRRGKVSGGQEPAEVVKSGRIELVGGWFDHKAKLLTLGFSVERFLLFRLVR
jgi:hypothetical protein